jgi:hypothetical protein
VGWGMAQVEGLPSNGKALEFKPYYHQKKEKRGIVMTARVLQLGICLHRP